jgi:hypothetical protein
MRSRVAAPAQSMLTHVLKPCFAVVIQLFRRITLLKQTYIRVEIVFDMGSNKSIRFYCGKKVVKVS